MIWCGSRVIVDVCCIERGMLLTQAKITLR